MTSIRHLTGSAALALHSVRRLSLLLVLLVPGLWACDETKLFSEESPYAAFVGQYRYYEDALTLSQILQERGLDPYIVGADVPQSGKWYYVMLEARSEFEAMLARKIELEDKYSLNQLKIEHYTKLKPYLTAVGVSSGPDRITYNDPILPEKTESMLRLIPSFKSYRLRQLTLIVPSDSTDLLELPELRTLDMDLPRGMTLEKMLRATGEVAELVYKDISMGHEATMHVFSLDEGHTLGDSLTVQLAQRILDTREYLSEEMQPIEISGASPKLTGYMVSIGVRKEQIKRYLILTDKQNRLLVFIQSSRNMASEMVSIASAIGKTEGLMGYFAVQQTLSLAPARPESSADPLLLFQLNLLDEGASAKTEGYYRARCNFLSVEGTWDLTVTLTDEARTATEMYDRLAQKAKQVRTEPLELSDGAAFITYQSRRLNNSRKPVDFPNQITFHHEYYLGTLSNRGKAWLDKDQLAARMFRLQLFDRPEKRSWF